MAGDAEEAELLRRHESGDSRALEELLERHEGSVCALFRAHGVDDGRVEDLWQSTLLAAYTAIDTFDRTSGFGPWLRGIARNVCRRARRRASYRQTEPFDEAQHGVQSAPRERSDEDERMLGLILRLPAVDYRLLSLMYVEERSRQEVAALLGISASAVAQRLYSIKCLLRERGDTSTRSGGGSEEIE